MTTLTTDTFEAYEKDTLSIQVSFFDSDQVTAVTPNTLAWTLKDITGTVINARSAITLTPATSVWIELTGDDLAMTATGRERRLLLTGTYNSIIHGTNRQINREIKILIQDALLVS